MSLVRRTSSMMMTRTSEAVRHRPGVQARLLPTPFLPTILHLNYHYKRCPKALRLCLRSDQSPSRPQHGRSPDKSRHTLSKGYCQVRAPLTRRIRFASSGDAPERSVMSLPRAIAPPWAFAPFPDSPGLDLAGQSEQSYDVRLKTNAPFKDSTVVTTGELRSTNGGHGSPLPSLRVVEHFWWTGLPHAEIFSGLVRIPSEVRGCRRVVPDVNRPQGRTPRIGTGVDAFSRKRPGPSTPCPNKSKQSLNPMNHSADGNAPCSTANHPPRGACPPLADHSQLASGYRRNVRLGTVRLRREATRRVCPEFLEGVERGAAHDCQFVTSSPTTHERTRLLPHTHTISSARSKENVVFPTKQSKIVPESAHQSKLPLTSSPAPTSPSIPNTGPELSAWRRPASTVPWKAAGRR